MTKNAKAMGYLPPTAYFVYTHFVPKMLPETTAPRIGPLRNPRHEQFVQLVATGISPSEAYTSVGYRKSGAYQCSSRLLKDVQVCSRLKEIQAQHTESRVASCLFDEQRVINRLDVLSRKAEADGNYAAAVRCEELIGKQRGMFVDRVDQRTLTLNDLSTEVLTQLLQQAQPQKALEAPAQPSPSADSPSPDSLHKA
jgi:hypothetical protein